jgi:hypothetical protein
MEDTIEQLGNSLKTIDSIIQIMNDQEKEVIDSILNVTDLFMKVYHVEESKLPYHINILDLIWANENAHSRILAALLQQQKGTEYDVLDGFCKYLGNKYPDFSHIEILHPQITCEKDRIDLIILGRNFALIIENKIHNAIDQGSQLGRYIKIVKSKGYDEQHIWVIYLTRDENKKPEDHSWIYEGINYQERIKNRYLPISYRYDILPWLQDYVLPECRVKDVFLKSTVEQYIDYLEGLFNTRKIQDNMNKVLQDRLKELLEINPNNGIIENRTIIKNKLYELERVKNQMDNLLAENNLMLFDEWVHKLKEEYAEIYYKHDLIKNLMLLGVVKTHLEKKFTVFVEYKIKEGKVYYGIGVDFTSEIKHDEIAELVNKLDLENLSAPLTYGWSTSVDFVFGYDDLLGLISKLESTINNTFQQE